MLVFDKHFRPTRIHPDSAQERFAFLILGEENGVNNAARQRASSSWHGKFLLPLFALLTIFAIIIFGWIVGLAGMLGSILGSAIYYSAQDSLREQINAEREARREAGLAQAVSDFVAKVLVCAQRLTQYIDSDLHVSNALMHVRAISITAIQRSFESLNGLVHISLSQRLLLPPVCPR